MALLRMAVMTVSKLNVHTIDGNRLMKKAEFEDLQKRFSGGYSAQERLCYHKLSSLRKG